MSGHASAALRRGVLLWAALLLVVMSVPVLTAEEVLLSLPREFDVTAHRPAWDDAPASIERPPPLVFRFRGERFRATWRGVSRPSPDNPHVYEETFEGTFRRGRLEGTYEHYYQGSWTRRLEPPECPAMPRDPYYKNWERGRIQGTATSDGLLSLTLDVTWHKAMSRRYESDGGRYGCRRDLGWVDVTRESETEYAQKWTPYTETIILRLPVGELQSSQTLSTPAPTRPPPVEGGRSRGSGATTPGATSAEGGAAGGRAPDPAGPRESAGRTNASDAPSPWSLPVTPSEAAGAGAAVALTSLLGALWMFGTSGLSPGDLLGSPPEADAPEPSPAESPSPRELFVERHRDGEVNPDTDEVWSESAGGWVGSKYHEIERRAQAEVRRAQGVSDRESRRESARIAEELRASRKREAEAVRRGEKAAEEAVWLQAETIDPYQPGIVDGITTGLERAEWATDTGMSVVGSLAGQPGEKFARVYTVAKETVKGLSEGVADYRRGEGGHAAEEGSAWVIFERGVIGASKGMAKVGLDAGAGKLMDGAGAVVSETGAAQGAKAVVKTVTHQLDSPAAVETGRSVGVAVGKTLAGSEMAAPVNKGIKAATGENM